MRLVFSCSMVHSVSFAGRVVSWVEVMLAEEECWLAMTGFVVHAPAILTI